MSALFGCRFIRHTKPTIGMGHRIAGVNAQSTVQPPLAEGFGVERIEGAKDYIECSLGEPRQWKRKLACKIHGMCGLRDPWSKLDFRPHPSCFAGMCRRLTAEMNCRTRGVVGQKGRGRALLGTVGSWGS